MGMSPSVGDREVVHTKDLELAETCRVARFRKPSRRNRCGPGRGHRARIRRAPSGCRDPRDPRGSAPGDEGGQGRVTGVSDQGQRIALLNPVAFADPQGGVPRCASTTTWPVSSSTTMTLPATSTGSVTRLAPSESSISSRAATIVPSAGDSSGYSQCRMGAVHALSLLWLSVYQVRCRCLQCPFDAFRYPGR